MSRPFAKLKEEIKKEILQLSFPIGQPYVTQTNTNPSTILGFGTWERVKGKVLVGLDEEDTDFNEIGKVGGEKTHILTISETPAHNHSSDGYVGSGDGAYFYATCNGTGTRYEQSAYSSTVGGNQSHNNLQPYQVVGYIWIRIA